MKGCIAYCERKVKEASELETTLTSRTILTF